MSCRNLGKLIFSWALLPWQHAKRPMTGIRYDQWSKPSYNGRPHWEINVKYSWNSVKRQLKATESWERVQCLNKHAMLEEIQAPLYWTGWKRLHKTLNQRDATALLTWQLGSRFLKISDSRPHGYMRCRHCQEPDTAVHVLRLRKETNRHFKAIPEEWEIVIMHGITLEFWSQGLICQPQYRLDTGGASVETWGRWSMHDPMPVKNRECLLIGIAATSQDPPRLRHVVVSVVHHTLKDGELYHLGCITAVVPYGQSFPRAWFYGLRIAVHFVALSEDVRIRAMSTQAFEAWNKQKHNGVFWDLNCLVTPHHRARTAYLCV